jgi:hypothetical protein
VKIVVVRCPRVPWQSQTSNPDSLSSSEEWAYLVIKNSKKHLSKWARCQKAVGGAYFTKKSRAEALGPGLKFDNFKSRLNSGIFKCFSWLNGSFFEGNDRYFVKEGVKTDYMTPIMSPLYYASAFTSIVYDYDGEMSMNCTSTLNSTLNSKCKKIIIKICSKLPPRTRKIERLRKVTCMVQDNF